MARHDQSDQPGIGILDDGKPTVVRRDAPRWRPDVIDDPSASPASEGPPDGGSII
jgi:hypothetical protein